VPDKRQANVGMSHTTRLGKRPSGAGRVLRCLVIGSGCARSFIELDREVS